jgi:hypothetical protein
MFRRAGRIPLYTTDELDQWVEAKLSKPLRSTCDNGEDQRFSATDQRFSATAKGCIRSTQSVAHSKDAERNPSCDPHESGSVKA